MSCMPSNIAFHPAFCRPVMAAAAIDEAVTGARRPASRRRPKLLIHAAKAGQAGWRRQRDLPQVLGTPTLPDADTVLRLLEARETHLNESRLARAADYSIERHVLVLIALLAELRAAVHGEAEPDLAPAAEIVPFSARGTARQAHP